MGRVWVFVGWVGWCMRWFFFFVVVVGCVCVLSFFFFYCGLFGAGVLIGFGCGCCGCLCFVGCVVFGLVWLVGGVVVVGWYFGWCWR